MHNILTIKKFIFKAYYDKQIINNELDSKFYLSLVHIHLTAFVLDVVTEILPISFQIRLQCQ